MIARQRICWELIRKVTASQKDTFFLPFFAFFSAALDEGTTAAFPLTPFRGTALSGAPFAYFSVSGEILQER